MVNFCHSFKRIFHFKQTYLYKAPLCKYQIPENEYTCYKELHSNSSTDRYEVNVSDELKIPPETLVSVALQERQACLQKVSRHVDLCIHSLVQECEQSAIRATKLIRFRMEPAASLLKYEPDVKIILYVF